MAHLRGKERSQYVQEMFGKIADRYNTMNRLMTFGQDMRWRRHVVKQAALPSGGKLLDIATGTGDIAFEAQRTVPDAQVIGADFSIPMMRVGQKLIHGDMIKWIAADALVLPFSNNTFDAVVSGYLVRNVIDIPQTLAEQMRILKPGGRIVILDTSPPPDNLLKPFIKLHLSLVIPAMGRLIAGEAAADAYTYLPESTQSFKTPEELAEIMRDAGYQDVSFTTFMFGTMAVHQGIKPQA